MEIDRETERQRLRKERDRLNGQIAQLIAEDWLLTGLDNPQLREYHQGALARHQEEYRAFRSHLERFHQRFGPIGE